jgi:hypothetical protein
MACCKPRIRKAASKWNWIVGTSSKTRHKTGTHLVFVMHVVERPLTFYEYSKDPRFEMKIPRYGLFEQRGDNIYFGDDEKSLRQRVPSYHSKGWKLGETWEEDECQKQHDLSGKFVLVSGTDDFWYFGKSMEIPEEYRWVIIARHGHSGKFDPKKIAEFIDWIQKMKPGIHGDPFDLYRGNKLDAGLWK